MSKEFSFHGQRAGEEVTSVVKNHPIILFFPGLKTIIVLLLGISAMLFGPAVTQDFFCLSAL